MLLLLLAAILIGEVEGSAPDLAPSTSRGGAARVIAPPTAPDPPANRIDVLVVCARKFLPDLQPWIRYRRQQGYRLAHLAGNHPAEKLQQTIRKLAQSRGLRYVVIVGDADTTMTENPLVREQSVPTFYGEATVVTRYGSEPIIPSDNPFADLDDDGVPDLAVGRISVDEPRELTVILRKILAFENDAVHKQSSADGLWKRKIDVVAGVGGFGTLTDALVEGAAKKFITDDIPPEFETTMTYANWRSPYCPDPRRFRDVVLNRMNQGGLFWVYVGHGHPTRLDRIRTEDIEVPILEPEDVARLQCRSGFPIAVLLACYTGAYDQPYDCLAEQLVRQPGGPVAAVCGSRVTTPYAMSIFASGLLDGYFDQKLVTLGDVFLAAKRELARPNGTGSTQRKVIDSLARTFSPTKDQLPGERAEHQLLLNLLGDPLLHLPYATPMRIECRRIATAGDLLTIEGETPVAGDCILELVCRRDLTTTVTEAGRERTPQTLEEMTDRYARANNKRWASRQLELREGRFVAELQIPPHCSGSSHVRMFVQGPRGYAQGAAPVLIEQPADADPLSKTNADRQ
jgi:hypothetical protein